MFQIVRLVLASLLLLQLQLSFAQKPLNYIPDRSCRSAITEPEILACMHAEFNFYEHIIKKYSTGILALLDKQDGKVFSAASEAWGQYRKLNCSLLYKFESKTFSRIMDLACKILKAKDRQTELKKFFSKLGGDEDALFAEE